MHFGHRFIPPQRDKLHTSVYPLPLSVPPARRSFCLPLWSAQKLRLPLATATALPHTLSDCRQNHPYRFTLWVRLCGFVSGTLPMVGGRGSGR
jgi:hypothetical protein